MKKFHFQLDPYLRLQRHELEAAQARSAQLRDRQGQLRRLAEQLLTEKQTSLQRLAEGTAVSGGQLQALDAWRGTLAKEAAKSSQQAAELAGPLRRAADVEKALRVRVELIERLRAKRQSHHRSLEDRATEELSAELHLAARRRASSGRAAD